MPNSYQDSQAVYVDRDTGVGLVTVERDSSATRTFTTEDSNKVVVATKSSATQTFTLPKASSVAGMAITLICGDAGGEINFAVDAADSIVGMTFAAVGTDADTAALSTTAGHGIKNTGATNVVGDRVRLVSDGVATWFIDGIAVGIWAAL